MNDTSQMPLTHALLEAARRAEEVAKLQEQVRALEGAKATAAWAQGVIDELKAERDHYWRTARRLGQIEGDEAARREKGR